MAYEMKRKNIPLKTIASITELPIEIIKKIKINAKSRKK
jgi:hypothetical protein